VKPAIIAVSENGIRQAERLREYFNGADLYVPPALAGRLNLGSGYNYSPGPSLDQGYSFGDQPVKSGEQGRNGAEINEGKGGPGLSSSEPEQKNTFRTLEKGFYPGVAKLFDNYSALIFISAVAVAVRAVAPCLKGKDSDPAVVVVDEGAQFAISLLSGHLGGANELTEKVAACLNARAVITTATDGQGLPAFDDLARKWGWTIENLAGLKEISAALLEGREITLYSRQPFNQIPGGNIYYTTKSEELSRARNGAVIIENRLAERLPLPETPYIFLRPCNVAAGVGCRKNVAAGAIIEAVQKAFQEAGLSIKSLNCLASGEFKAEEKGLLEAARHFKVPLKIFECRQIEGAIDENSTRSAFVQSQVGVGAVAEPCACLGSNGGEIVVPVRREQGVTASLAEGDLFLNK